MWTQNWMLHKRAHVGDEGYSRSKGEQIIELTQRRGTRSYVLAKPYLPQPDFHALPQTHGHTDPSGRIGKVVSSEWQGMRQRTIGTAQAWYYPIERTIVLWEYFLETRYAKDTQRDDPNHHARWMGFETFPQVEFPQAHTMVTTHADPRYEIEDYPVFLT